MPENLAIALIGCGAAGKLHARAVRESGIAELRWVADCEPRAAQSLGERLGAAWTVEIDRVLGDPSVEAVSIAVPHHLHLDIASRAARAGKHVLLEKPFTMNLAQAEQLLTLCRECGVTIVPWLERRFLPYADRARELVAEGAIGRIVHTRVSAVGYKPRAYWEYGMRFEEYPSSWRAGVATSGGGVLMMNAIHQIDLMAHVTGEVVAEVSANVATLHHEVEVEDMAVVAVRYASGALGVIEASCCAFGMNHFPIEAPPDVIMGTDGHIRLGAPLRSFDRLRFSHETDFPKLSVVDMKVRQLANFASHLRDGASLRCTAADALRALGVVEAAYRSAAVRTPVRVVAPATR